MKTSADLREKVFDLVKEFSTAMLITHAGAGELRARPMAIADVTSACGLWFITNDESAKVHELQEDTRAHVVCQKEHSVYLSLSGRASLLKDRERIAALWKESFRVWFPDGKDDPNIVLIVFEPDRAEFWDNKGMNKVAYLWEATRAYVTGNTPHVNEGEQHGIVPL